MQLSALHYLRRPPHVFYRALVLGTTATLCVLFLTRASPLLANSELRVYDAQFSLAGEHLASNRIVVVSLDTNSLMALGIRRLPMPRARFAPAINFLHRANARVIGVDWIFLGPSPYGRKDDLVLAKAIKGAGNVVLAEALDDQAEVPVLQPYAPLARSARSLGFVNVHIDPDGEVRASDLVDRGPSLNGAGETLSASLATELASVGTRRSLSATVAGLPRRHMLVDFIGRESVQDLRQNAFVTTPFSDVALGRAPPDRFRNKIVLIVPYFAVLDGFYSNRRTDTPMGAMFVGFVEANALNTILNRSPIRPVSPTTANLAVLLLGALATLAGAWLNSTRSFAAVLLPGLVYLAIALLLFQRFHVWINVVGPETALLLAGASVLALRLAVAWLQARRNRRHITVLFVDIRGYTAMSEYLEPERVADALDIYLAELTAQARAFAGTIAKYVGDEMMVLWNAPHRQADHAMLAVRAGVEMLASMPAINERLAADGLPTIRYGIGVNTGEAVVGKMSAYSKQYDVLGDTVNVAARLCGAVDGGEMFIGEGTRQLIAGRAVLEVTDPLRLKGKGQPVRAYRVVSLLSDTRSVAGGLPRAVEPADA